MAADDKAAIGQTHGSDDPESVLIGYLLGVEALRGRQTGRHVAHQGWDLHRYRRLFGRTLRARSTVHQGPSRRVRRERRPLLRVSCLRQDPQSRIGRLGQGCRSQRSTVGRRSRSSTPCLCRRLPIHPKAGISDGGAFRLRRPALTGGFIESSSPGRSHRHGEAVRPGARPSSIRIRKSRSVTSVSTGST